MCRSGELYEWQEEQNITKFHSITTMNNNKQGEWIDDSGLHLRGTVHVIIFAFLPLIVLIITNNA